MVISPFLVGDRGRAFSNFGKFFSVSRMHLLEGIFASGIIVEGSFFFSSSSSSSSRAATETGKRNAQKRLGGRRRRGREIERNRRRRGGWQPRTPTPPPRRGPVLGFYVLTSFHSVYESPLRFTTDHRGPFLSARFYRPVYAGRRAKGKGRETRRRSLRWKGGRQKQHRRYLRIFPSHACMRDPLDGRRSIDFGGGDWRRFFKFTRRMLLSRSPIEKVSTESCTIRRGIWPRRGAEALKIEGHSGWTRVASAWYRCVIERGTGASLPGIRGQAAPGKDSRGARELESIGDSGKLSGVRVGMYATEARIEVESVLAGTSVSPRPRLPRTRISIPARAGKSLFGSVNRRAAPMVKGHEKARSKSPNESLLPS